MTCASRGGLPLPRESATLLEGDPVIVVEGGKPIDRNLRRNRITHEEGGCACAPAEFARAEDIRWAVLETSGRSASSREAVAAPAAYLTESDVEAAAQAGRRARRGRGLLPRMSAALSRIGRDRLRVEDGASRSWRRRTTSSGSPASRRTPRALGGRRSSSLFDLEQATCAVIEADKLGQLRTGAASGVAARYLAKPAAKSLGVIGCGWQAESQVACIRAAVPSIERVVAYCRTEERPGGVLRRRSAPSRRVAPRRRRAGRRRHGDDVARPGAPRRVAPAGRARLRGRRERPGRASSTTSSSSARRSSAATRSSRRGSSRAT